MILLCILDGFGLREATPDNAVAAAYKPNYDRLVATCPFTTIDGSGHAVGLPEGQMGNSEVGHLNLGAGRVVYQDISRIDLAIRDGSFFENAAFVAAMKRLKETGNTLHLIGLLSNGKVHSSLDHLYALLELAKRNGVSRVCVHGFMDGRDTPPNSGIEYMRQVQEKLLEIGVGRVATVGGRYYGMDRDKRWERVEKAYQAIVNGVGERFDNPIEAIQTSYDNGVMDEFILPVTIGEDSDDSGRLASGDVSIIFNFRADRVRQISQLFLGRQIDGVNHPENPSVELVTMTQYDAKMHDVRVAFGPTRLEAILGEVLS